MRFVIVTGMSGAGKSSVLKFLEDLDYFCVDNLPPALLPKFAEICVKAESDIENVALGIDIRGGRLFEDFFSAVNELKNDYACSILFVDANEETLITRFKETRRSHPLAKNDRIEAGIAKEKLLLEEVKKKADFIIDTTQLLSRELKEKINEIFAEDKTFSSLMITVLSFGFKYGIPRDADLVFDVRFIPNPFYIADLKEHTGADKAVRDYVFSHDVSGQFLDKLVDMSEFLIPNYISEGKNQLVIAIGCTGGKHRSVALANELYNILQNHGQSVIIKHRDISRDKH